MIHMKRWNKKDGNNSELAQIELGNGTTVTSIGKFEGKPMIGFYNYEGPPGKIGDVIPQDDEVNESLPKIVLTFEKASDIDRLHAVLEQCRKQFK